MSIYFIRHGQTDWNRAGRWQGQSEVPLNVTGLSQSQGVADSLSKENLGASFVVSSPKGRARHTAEIVADRLGLRVKVEPLFRELNLGDYEGCYTEELERDRPEEFKRWLASHHQLPAPGGGETLADGVNRVKEPLRSWLERAGNKDLLIVAHQAINICMKSIISGHGISRINDADLIAYKQSNSQIDVWGGQPTHFIKRIEADYVR